MVTDDERREVAERLRELHLNPWDDAACEIAQCAGIACCNSECHGSNETPECTMALCAHLADLIDPDCEEGRYEGVRTTRPVDREALLALAGDLEKKADKIIQAAQDSRFTGLGPRMCENKHEACKWRGIARRIREACGEVA